MNRIEAWLRLRDTNRFNRDANRAAENIDEIGRAADRADTAGSGLARTFDTAGLSGGQLAKQASILGGRTGVLVTLAMALAPALIAVGGALVAVAGSATMAAIGLGTLATTGLATVAVGVGGLGIIAGQAAGQFDKVTKALDAYNLAVEEHGKGSEQAASAMDKLAAVVEQNGGTRMLDAVQRWKELGDQWQRLTGPARGALADIFWAALAALDRLMPTLASITNVVSQAIVEPMKDAFALLSGGAMREALGTMGDTFAKMAPHLISAAADFFLFLARASAAAAPYLIDIAEAIGSFFHDLRASTAEGGGFFHFLTEIILHLKSWWAFGVAIFKLMGAILFGGAQQGQGLLDIITGLVEKWTAFLGTPEGQAAMRQFFADAINFAKGFITFVVNIIVWIVEFAMAVWRVYEAIQRVDAAIAEAWEDFKTFLSQLPGYIANIGSSMWDGIVSGFKAAINAVIGLWNGINFSVNVPDWLPGVPDEFKFETPDIPLLAQGGLIQSGGQAIVGDAGPELATMTPRGAVITPLPSFANPRAAEGALGTGGHKTIVLQVDKRTLSRVTLDAADDEIARA